MINQPRSIASWTACLCALIAVFALPVRADSAPAAAAVIAVSGTGEVVLTPDRASLIIGVETSANTAAAAGADNAKIHQAVKAALTAAGVASSDLSSVGYSVTTTWKYTSGAPVKTGYRASNSVKVEVHDLDRIGPLLDVALGAGATGVNDVSYEAKDEDQARQQALVKAVAQARSDADTLAKAAGGRLGNLLQLGTYSDQNAPSAGLQEIVVTAAKRQRGDQPTEVDAQQIRITATVNGRWQFVPSGG